jgi:uncharacterized cupin superfamily protein
VKRFNVWDPASSDGGDGLIIDDDEPDGYGAEYARIGPVIGAERLAANLVVLKQDEKLCPYHYELAEEEWLIVLAGTPTVRTPDGNVECEPGDVMNFPIGPDGAHQICNFAEAPARVIMLSERHYPAASVYPDSDKLGIFFNLPEYRTLVKRTDEVEYWVDEPPPPAR